MKAAIYARKSNEDDRSEENRSIPTILRAVLVWEAVNDLLKKYTKKKGGAR